jgi:fructose-bisphosphate aldolase class I
MEVSEVTAQALIGTAKAMVAEGKGLLAMDESTPNCNQRFEKVGIPQTEETRRSYRELIMTTPGLGEFISGVILYDETIRQSRKDGTYIHIIFLLVFLPLDFLFFEGLRNGAEPH